MSAKTHLSRQILLLLTLSFLLPVTLTGCLLGLGAAAGAAVGGCALMDENEDDVVSAAEFSRGLFASWDTNDDGSLSENEFDAGTERSERYDSWTDDFDDWDTDDDAEISATEFDAQVAEDAMVAGMLDDECDDLGL